MYVHILKITIILLGRKILVTKKEDMKWVSLSTWGYRDSPFTWESQQHYYFTNGENDYTFILLSPTATTTKQVPTIACQMYGSDHIQK